ncbi:MAG: hypothetical protein IKA22_12685 [Lentisphaeria bacterium]|nr:hypothetical protein [Lentisphaeria bacterium]
MFLRLLLFFFAAFACCAEELTVAFDGRFCSAGNTHSAGQIKYYQRDELLLVSKVRDLYLFPVKKPSDCIFKRKNLSNLSVESKVKFKSGGKNLTGRIIGIDEFYYQIDIPVTHGDSGKTVFDMSGNPVGMVSHYVIKNGRKLNCIVRMDNLKKSEFEIIKADDLLRDWRIFNEFKEYEYGIIQGLKECSSYDATRKFLLSQMVLRKEYIGWKSTYLKNETKKSRKTISDIFERFLK